MLASIQDILSNCCLHGCPCGFYGDPIKECSCSASAIARYQKRISGPLLDRIDIHLEVPRVDYEKLADKRNVENSETVRKRVQAARERQLQRFRGTKLTCNAEMGPSEVREFCSVEASTEKLLKAVKQQLHLSARAFHIFRPSRLWRELPNLPHNMARGFWTSHLKWRHFLPDKMAAWRKSSAKSPAGTARWATSPSAKRDAETN